MPIKSIEYPQDKIDLLKKEAKKKGRSLSGHIRYILTAFIEYTTTHKKKRKKKRK